MLTFEDKNYRFFFSLFFFITKDGFCFHCITCLDSYISRRFEFSRRTVET